MAEVINENEEASRQALIKERLNERLQNRTARPNGRQRIPRRSVDGPAPLSPMQRGFWITQQMAPESRAAHRPVALRLTGPLHRPALEQSLNEIVQRHDVLRTAFPAQDGRPVQEVRPPEPLALEVRDLRVLSEREREARARQIARQEAKKTFDLTRRPPVRALLLRLSRHQHVLVLLLHHIVFDGWSEGVLRRELATLYDAFATGASSPLPELPVQYADVAAWQQKRLDDGVLESELRYWREQLGGAPPALNLPTDHPRPSAPIDRIAKHSFVLSRKLSEDLKMLGRQEEATLFMTLLAGFQVLLGRYTRQEDVVVGTPIAGRSRSEMEPLVGCFMNMLPLHTDLSGRPSFRALLGQVRRMTLSAYDHQALPFERLVEALQPERDPSRPPLFQVLFQLRNLPDVEASTAGDVRIEPFDFDPGVGGYDLTLEVTEAPEGLRCHFKYAPALFEADTVERMAGHFRTLLEAAADDPDRPVTTLPLLTEGERSQLLVEWNDTDQEIPRDECLHEMIEAQVRKTPDAVAVRQEDEQVTYGELNARANQIAHVLRAQGVEPETRVGIFLGRSIDQIAALLGVLKAGGAYVPLDPDYPESRLAFMLEDAAPAVVLTNEHLQHKLDFDGVVCRLDKERERLDRQPTHDPAPAADSRNLAYVIYTSGSTGRPKGVMIEHRSVVNLTCAVGKEYGIRESDRVLQGSPISFDRSVKEVFTTLTNGATLVLRTETMMDSSHNFLQDCAAQDLTVLPLPTAFWRELTTTLAAGSLVLPSSVRLVAFGGEAAPPEALALWRSVVGSEARLINAYGPTETTVNATHCTLPVPPDARGVLPIGRPIANTRVYVLDEHMQPVPVGVPGELYVGGRSVARGYLNRPECTAEAFIRDPFSDTPDARLYKTGDLVYWLPEGELAFIGRTDWQVNLRGFRIEPGEIEAVLEAHPAVRTCAVHVAQANHGDKQLAAYVVAEEPCTPDDLRRHLSKQLPSFMLPSSFTFLEALPKSPAGKVDRQALPQPEEERGGNATMTTPRTPVEEELADLWTEVLGLEQIGIHESFFEIGGHSLLALRVASRVSERLGATVTARTLFEAPTIAQLAPQITTEQMAGEAAMEEMLAEMETLSDEEAERLLHDEASTGTR